MIDHGTYYCSRDVERMIIDRKSVRIEKNLLKDIIRHDEGEGVEMRDLFHAMVQPSHARFPGIRFLMLKINTYAILCHSTSKSYRF